MITDSFLPFIAVVFPKFIIDELVIGRNLKSAITLVVVFFSSNLVLNSINTVIDGVVNCKKEKLIQQHYKTFSEKTMDMDLEDIENTTISDRKNRAQQVITWNSRNIDGIKNAIGGILSFSIQVIGFSYILSRLNVFIIVLVVGIIIVDSLLNNYQQKLIRKKDVEMTPINRQWDYLTRITEDYSFGKLIRIYHFAPMILKKCIENRKLFKEKRDVIQRISLYKTMVLTFLSLVQEGIVYIFLISSVVSGTITLGDFTMYLAAMMAFSNAVNNIIGFTIGLNYTTQYVNDFIEFINLPDSLEKSGGKRTDDVPSTFEFRNVSYKYPNSHRTILKNLNISFKMNDRITLVGDNGAGKTTFVKLLMRFYDPTSGEILLNGKNIKDYDYHEYFKIFSAVFQDYQFFAFTIAENIAFNQADNRSREHTIMDALNKVGMLEKVTALPQSIYSYMGKAFEEDGVEFSGGEMQKIAIARSIYKNGYIFILDEPTANLSPIAEHNIFKSFNESTVDKTVLYISHRLSSSAFSNRILVFEDGAIVEDGTHKELMEKSGLYKKMYDMQAGYYINEEVDLS